MRILAFDCAGAQCAASILAGEEIIAADRIQSERGHAQLLMPLLIDLIGRAGMGFRDFDRFAVTTGPGSFTGIRVALAAAHGLALGTGKPIIGATVFETLAAAVTADGPSAPRLLIAVESRRAECFFQLFDGAGLGPGDPIMLPPDRVPDWVGPGPLAVAGDAVGRVLPFLDQAVGLDSRFQRVDPAVLAKLAAWRIPARPPAPFYLRPPDAMPSAARPRR